MDSRDDLMSDPLLVNVPIHDGQKILGGVLLERMLGHGGMGWVYKGRHQRLNIDVAVKVMLPPDGGSAAGSETFVKRFTREAQMAASVTHQNLVRVIDVNFEHGLHYLVMDYVDGESLGARLRQIAVFTVMDAVEIALGAARGLAEAHAKGIVHRDIKPDNIMLDKHGRVRVTDLGIAKAVTTLSGELEESRLTQSYMALGTPFYMAPEQFISAHDVGPAADVWSLGVTLYQMLTGEFPWYADNALVLLTEIETKPLPSLKTKRPDVSDGLCEVLARALEKRPDMRYADCGKMADALAQLSHPQQTSEPESDRLYIPIEPFTKSREMLRPEAVPKPAPPIVPDQIERRPFQPPYPGPIQRRVESEKQNHSSRRTAPAHTRNWTWVVVTVSVLVAMAVALSYGSEYLRQLARLLDVDGPKRKPPAPSDARPDAPKLEEDKKGKTPDTDGSAAETDAPGGHTGRSRHGLSRDQRSVEDSAPIALTDASEPKDELRIEYLELMAKGMALRRAGKTAEAIAAFTAARSRAPLDTTKPQEAIRACHHDDHVREAEDAERRGDLADAVVAYDKALGFLDEQSTRLTRAAAAGRLKHERALRRALQLISRREWADAKAALDALALERPKDEQIRELLVDVRRYLPAEADLTVELAQGVELDAIFVKPGRFRMGHDSRIKGGGQLSHEVRLRSGYYLSRTEVTVRQFAAFVRNASYRTLAETQGYSFELQDDGSWTRANDSTWRDPGFTQGENHPVVCVSWRDAKAFCRYASRKAMKNCRLPTEAEWEFACRAGADTAYGWGNDTSAAHEYCNSSGHRMLGKQEVKGDTYANTAEVGSFPPNAWGLSDMHGNVWEWCADWYAPTHSVTRLGTDTGGPAQGKERIVRGGAWSVSASRECTASFRGHREPTLSSNCTGFRVLFERQ